MTCRGVSIIFHKVRFFIQKVYIVHVIGYQLCTVRERKWLKLVLPCSIWILPPRLQVARFSSVSLSSVMLQKTGTNYPNLEPGNEFWNRVWYKSLDVTLVCDRSVNVTTLPAARCNGSMYAHVFILPAAAKSTHLPDWINSQSVPLTKYEVPQASTFQLISDSAESKVRWENCYFKLALYLRVYCIFLHIISSIFKLVSKWRICITLL